MSFPKSLGYSAPINTAFLLSFLLFVLPLFLPHGHCLSHSMRGRNCFHTDSLQMKAHVLAIGGRGSVSPHSIPLQLFSCVTVCLHVYLCTVQAVLGDQRGHRTLRSWSPRWSRFTANPENPVLVPLQKQCRLSSAEPSL